MLLRHVYLSFQVKSIAVRIYIKSIENQENQARRAKIMKLQNYNARSHQIRTQSCK